MTPWQQRCHDTFERLQYQLDYMQQNRVDQMMQAIWWEIVYGYQALSREAWRQRLSDPLADEIQLTLRDVPRAAMLAELVR